MKRFACILAALLLKAASAHAGGIVGFQTIPISSATWCTVSVSSQSATRVDNFNGLCEGLMSSPDRTEVKLCSPAGNALVNFGYNNAVSTTSSNARYGEELPANSCKDLVIDKNVTVYALSSSVTAAQNITIIQAHP